MNFPTSADGVVISKNNTFVIGGLKVQDDSAVTPLTKRRLYDRLSPESACVQSYENCCITRLAAMKETKKASQHFLGPLYEETCKENDLPDDAVSQLVPPLDGEEPFKPFRHANHGDLKQHWFMTGRGGGAKTKAKFCHACPCTSENIAKPNTKYCDRCEKLKEEGKIDSETWRCYHTNMFTETNKETLQAELQELGVPVGEWLESEANELEDLWEQSALNYSDYDPFLDEASTGDPKRNTNSLMAKNEPKSIFFDLEKADARARQDYKKKLMHDLVQVRKVTLGRWDHTASSLQKRLHDIVKKEHKILEAWKEFLENEGVLSDESACYIALNALPCLLHMENRVNLKMVTVLLNKGLGYREPGAEHDAYIEQCSNIINRQMPANYNLSSSYDTSKKVFHTLTMDNHRMRKVMKNMDLLIDLTFEGEEALALQWKEAISHYRDAMLVLQSKDDLSRMRTSKRFSFPSTNTSISG